MIKYPEKSNLKEKERTYSGSFLKGIDYPGGEAMVAVQAAGHVASQSGSRQQCKLALSLLSPSAPVSTCGVMLATQS